jgi:hypothetical protein
MYFLVPLDVLCVFGSAVKQWILIKSAITDKINKQTQKEANSFI